MIDILTQSILQRKADFDNAVTSVPVPTLKITGLPCTFSVTSHTSLNSLGLSIPFRKAATSLFGPDHSQLKVLGMTTALLSHKNNSCTQPIYIIKELKSNLLGLPAIKDLKLLLNMYSFDKSITSEYPLLFTGHLHKNIQLS